MVTRPVRPLLLLIGAVVLAAPMISCNFIDIVAPGKQVVIVHAVLDLGAPSQVVIVEYSEVAGASVRIAGAQVSITTSDGIQMAGVPDTATTRHFGVGGPPTTTLDTIDYRVSPSAYGVSLVPGRTYRLHVHTPAGEDVTGTTTIPLAAPVTIDTTKIVFKQLSDTLRFSWSDVVGAAAYELRTEYGGNTPPACCGVPVYVAFTTNPVSLSGTLRNSNGDHVLPRSGDVAAIVSAVDQNYYEYYRVLSDPFIGAAPSHLTGGMGVFGSLVPIAGRRLAVQ
jgi:uncharacterized protein DUF4249